MEKQVVTVTLPGWVAAELFREVAFQCFRKEQSVERMEGISSTDNRVRKIAKLRRAQEALKMVVDELTRS